MIFLGDNIVNPFFSLKSLFFLKNCFWSSCFLLITESITVDTSGKTTSGITSICFTIWEEIGPSEQQRSECIISDETCFSTTVSILLSESISTITSSKCLFGSFFSEFLPYQIDFSLLGRESSGSFCLFNASLVISYYFSGCCVCWLPCPKLRLCYRKIDNGTR